MFYNDIITESYDGDVSITGEYITSVMTEMLTEYMNMRQMMFNFDMTEVRALRENNTFEIEQLYEGALSSVIDKVKSGFKLMADKIKELFTKFKEWMFKSKTGTDDIKRGVDSLKDKNLSKFVTYMHDYDFDIVVDIVEIVDVDEVVDDLRTLRELVTSTDIDHHAVGTMRDKYRTMMDKISDAVDDKLRKRGLNTMNSNSNMSFSFALDAAIRGKSYTVTNPDYTKFTSALAKYDEGNKIFTEYNTAFAKIQKETNNLLLVKLNVSSKDVVSLFMTTTEIAHGVETHLYRSVATGFKLFQEKHAQSVRILDEMIAFKG